MGFSKQADDDSWSGVIAGPDRLRFLGMLSRYAALLAGIEMHEAEILQADTDTKGADSKDAKTQDAETQDAETRDEKNNVA